MRDGASSSGERVGDCVLYTRSRAVVSGGKGLSSWDKPSIVAVSCVAFFLLAVGQLE